MTIKQACELLAVSMEDSPKRIKSQFHKMMNKYHPDSVGSDNPEHIKRAQRINEAYALISKHKNHVTQKFTQSYKNQKQNVTHWKGTCNEEAFCQRNIYMATTDLFGERADVCQVARGRYLWNPDQEELKLIGEKIYIENYDSLRSLESLQEVAKTMEYVRKRVELFFRSNLDTDMDNDIKYSSILECPDEYNNKIFMLILKQTIIRKLNAIDSTMKITGYPIDVILQIDHMPAADDEKYRCFKQQLLEALGELN